MTDLPCSWARAKFSDLGPWIGGGTPSKRNQDFWNGPIAWISPKDMKTTVIWETIDKITAEAVERSSARCVPPKSVLIVTRSGILAHSLPVALTGVASALNQDLKAMVPPDGILGDYIAWALRAFEHRILRTCRKGGTTVPSIEMPRLSVFEIPVAPTNEQRRIVERIEALFEDIDRGVESLKAAKNGIALYRQSLLKSAFEGRLTANWRAQNLDKVETPDALLARIRKEREARYQAALEEWEQAVSEWRNDGKEGKRPAKPKLPERFDLLCMSDHLPWPRARVQVLLNAPLINGRSVKDKAGGFPVLRLTALKNGRIDFRKSKEGDWSRDDAEPFFVQRGDIFIARGNGSKKLVGIAGLILDDPIPIAFPDTMIRARLDTSAVQPEYIVLAWNSSIVRRQIEKAARTTAGIYKINQGHICEFVLPLPSLAEQAELVQVLQGRLEVAEELDLEIEASLARADALRQSILKEAFSGQLVPQDLDDEHASDLLERIKAERAMTPVTKR